ncbi:MAG: Esterase/lipase [Rhodococcus erythropolis]|nr:Esterase/lipase [Rhodococcus erythropolis]
MASARMKLLSIYLRRMRKPNLATPEAAIAHLSAPKGDPTPPRRIQNRFTVTRRSIDGFYCYTVQPKNITPTRTVVYVHGGSYVNEIVSPHWSFIAKLANSGCRVEVPIYGLAPIHEHHAAMQLVTAVYRDILTQFAPNTIAIVGDSAGGGLALAVTQTLHGAGLLLPGKLVLISPWLDITLSNPAIPLMEHKDPWLNREPLTEFAHAWANGTDLDTPALSPINGPLNDLPPIDLFIGTHDIVYPDALRLRELAEQARTPITLHVVEGGIHVYVLAPVPEGRAARRRIIESLAPYERNGRQER